MENSYISKKDLDSEMTVVRNEYERGENNPANILRERVLETAYLWHNYGHPTIGARSDIENVPIANLQKFYHTYYQPDNAVLIVAGNFDAAKALALHPARCSAPCRGRPGSCPIRTRRSRLRTASARSPCGARAARRY